MIINKNISIDLKKKSFLYNSNLKKQKIRFVKQGKKYR